LDVAENAYACAVGADVLVLATDWDEYRELDFARLRAAVRTPSLVDLRNALPASAVRAAGFSYVGVGRASLTIERDDS
jgi:UDPglucose 6-dehydrogenase